MNDQELDALLKDLYRENRPEPDFGFSRRVASRLPPPRRALLSWRSLPAWLGAAGALLAALFTPLADSVAGAVHSLLSGDGLDRIALTPLTALFFLLLTTGGSALAWLAAGEEG
jgi:hypothetical protein